jgi:hypothetical protein
MILLKVKQSGEFSVIGFLNFQLNVENLSQKNFLPLSFCPIRKNEGVSRSLYH